MAKSDGDASWRRTDGMDVDNEVDDDVKGCVDNGVDDDVSFEVDYDVSSDVRRPHQEATSSGYV